jgi:hypothetical protein
VRAIELLYDALPPAEPPEPPEPGTCCALGTREPTIERSYAIKTSFTNLDLLRAPDSQRVSVRAWRVLTYSRPAAEGKRRDTFPLMQSSWICDGDKLTPLNRQDVRALVLFGVYLPAWCGYVTTSYKKHGSLRAPVNRQSMQQRWLFELDVVDCSDRARVTEWWERLRLVRVAGIPRPVIESLDCSAHLLAKHPNLWMQFERWARPVYRSPLYRFLTYLLPSEEEIRAQSN